MTQQRDDGEGALRLRVQSLPIGVWVHLDMVLTITQITQAGATLTVSYDGRSVLLDARRAIAFRAPRPVFTLPRCDVHAKLP